MKRSRVPVTVSLPFNLAQSFAKLAKAESKNKSQLFRDMLSVYEQRRREANRESLAVGAGNRLGAAFPHATTAWRFVRVSGA